MSAPDFVSIGTMLGRVERSSADFADRATVLSESIERVAATLIGMPGKTESHVSDDENRIELAFDRLPTWNLWVIDPECENEFGERRSEPLANVSIPRKMRAFPLLLKLLADIESRLNAQVEEIEAAIGLFDSQPKKPESAATKKSNGVKSISVLPPRTQPVVKKGTNDDLPF